MFLLTGVLVAAMAWLSVGWVWPTRAARPSPPSPPLRLAGVVCLEAALVQVLSFAHAVTGIALLSAHALVTAAAAFLAWRRGTLRWPRVRWPRHPAWILVALLGIAPFVSAVLYVPSNWDSMTYRLARVAHWIQQGSVEAYPTTIVRQLALPPGAEFLFLVLQSVARSDRLAAFVQLGAWLVLVTGAPRLARRLGAPARLAPWAAVLAGSVPMALLQASSTQNDLVTAALALAATEASLPFVHVRRRWRWTDVVVASCALAAGLIVKPTSIVAAAPFVLWGALGAVRSLREGGAALELSKGVGAASVVVAATLGLWILLGARASGDDPVAPFVYGGGGEVGDRIANVARGAARHLPIPDALETAIVPANGTIGCSVPATGCFGYRVLPHEDYVGNPAHAALALLLLLLAAVRWKALRPRARVTAAGVLLAWVGFHLLFRDNVWISRLQLPLFALESLLIVAIPAFAPRTLARFVPLGVAVALSAAGIWTSVLNQTRPPLNLSAAQAGFHGNYYASSDPLLGKQHDVVLQALQGLGCRRLGLVLGGDSYDYPLTWRAMQMGAEVRHRIGDDPWACVVFVDRDGDGPPAGVTQGHLLPTELPFLFISAAHLGAPATRASSSDASTAR